MKKMMVILLVLVMVFVMVGSTAVANQETGPYGLGYWRQYMRHNDDFVSQCPQGFNAKQVLEILSQPPRGCEIKILERHHWVYYLNITEAGLFDPDCEVLPLWRSLIVVLYPDLQFFDPPENTDRTSILAYKDIIEAWNEGH